MRPTADHLSACFAGANAATFSCGDSVAIADLEVSASAIAKALAIAISFAYAECEVDGGYACAYAATEVEEVAEAVAFAYAESLVGAWTCEGCDATVQVVAEALGSVLVKAATDAFAAVCGGGASRVLPHHVQQFSASRICGDYQISTENCAAESTMVKTCISINKWFEQRSVLLWPIPLGVGMILDSFSLLLFLLVCLPPVSRMQAARPAVQSLLWAK